MRVGFGYDSHRICRDRPMILGGVDFQLEIGLQGHSDADVLIHAIADAIYGALGEGDIGTHFPPTQASIEGINSVLILRHATERMRNRGYEIGNIDCTILSEAVRVAPHRRAILANLSETMEIREDCISVKGKTNEGMDAVGRQEGITAMATVLLLKGGAS